MSQSPQSNLLFRVTYSSINAAAHIGYRAVVLVQAVDFMEAQNIVLQADENYGKPEFDLSIKSIEACNFVKTPVITIKSFVLFH